jgi:hypothetical protein
MLPMAEDESIGQPVESAVPEASTQRPAEASESHALVRVVPTSGLSEMPLTDQLRSIGEIRGGVAMSLLCTHASRIEADNVSLREDKRELTVKLDDYRERYHAENKECAVLKRENVRLSQIKTLQRFVGGFGGLIAGVGFSTIVSGPAGWGIAAAIAGVALFAGGFWPITSKDKQ